MSNPIRHLTEAGHLGTFFIDGGWCKPDGREHAPIVNPATEEVVAALPLGSEADADYAVSAARRAFPGWARTRPEERAAVLDRIHALILERQELFAQALTCEMGAAITYARQAQVPLAAEHVRAARDNLASFPFIAARGSTAIMREAIGVCALITPWNWPLYQTTAKVAPALAAGCTMVLKPSELSPLSALLFAEVMDDAGVPPGVFNLVQGTGPTVGAALAAHPEVDMISITGSTRAGILVAQAAAPTVKRVAQELGGKSPNIILPDADLRRAVSLGVGAAFRNLGQSCSAPTRMIVLRSQLEEVERLAVAAASELVVGDPLADSTTHGPIANRPQFDRIQTMIGVGLEEGAKLIIGGPGRPDGLSVGLYARPTVFSSVHRNMRIAQEEIFGPVLSIIPYDTVEEAVDIANDSVYGLGAHVQGKDRRTMQMVAAQIRSGQVHLDYPDWDPNAPFGGYKRSGNGREYGPEGIEEYLETKAVLGFYR
ncbi:putative Aldehyde dehydrogenase [Bradyrhizobium sp. ORS 285]|uniref:aldehyde dehydrogenase family protein n=1 Tax=Bradyrhizobium sp. ORS 285 TaxID=115808 RepID=UPI0002409485|nr:aldehyde dehydrogenase family protein [Bradyrhizobium sp. ORS 285]CCD85152.1 putative Aldehyde dehydrogenase [Bradyrhizobium sp. ORS 285]SMX58208.1 putative Aldehyde dehydrogenase [Bradyrhizobium sp. ORS 285]